MFKFGKKKPPQLEDPEPVMRSKSNSFSLVSPRPHHSISFNRRSSEKPADPISQEQLKFGRKTLPANFAEQLLNLEIEVELNEQVQIDTWQELIQQYMTGVEYYESIKDRKHIYFQRKLNAVMIKPAFLMTTTKVNSQTELNETPAVDQKKKEFQDQQKKLQLDLIYGDVESKERQTKVKEMVSSHTQEMKRIDDLISQDMQAQEDNLKKRLEKRRKTGLTRAASLPRLSVEQATLAEVEKQMMMMNPEGTIPPPILETEKQSPRKQIDEPIGAISEEEDDDANPSRKTSQVKNRSKKSPSQLNFDLPKANAKLQKRQSLLLGLDVINQLFKKQQTRKDRSKSLARGDDNELSKDDRDVVRDKLLESHQTLMQTV